MIRITLQCKNILWFYSAMATTLINSLCAVVCFLSLIGAGNSQCHPITDLKIVQSPTQLQVQNKQQWKVTIVNDCVCTQTNIKLGCNGFHTVQEIDPSVMAISELEDDDGCHINDDKPLYGFATFNFTYAWDTTYLFMPIYSEIACS